MADEKSYEKENETLDGFIENLKGRGVGIREVQNIKHMYRAKMRSTPYSHSEIDQDLNSEAGLIGRLVLLENGGTLIVEYDLQTHGCAIEFRYITKDEEEKARINDEVRQGVVPGRVNPAFDEGEINYRKYLGRYDSTNVQNLVHNLRVLPFIGEKSGLVKKL